ncbi:unnamed protein product [Schistosoma curassoni]|uniref:EIF2A domain-containing protein n=1 Tax=Schistosoma curassoni TaxID=6186 RepID=A0A183JF76_9TREM|nr:unnamed protein product [Schistosoma curassoni]
MSLTLNPDVLFRLFYFRNIVVCCHWNPNGNSLVSCERIKKAIVWSSL